MSIGLSMTDTSGYPASLMNKSSITTIVAGGQTGADRGGLDAALEANVTTTGYVPKGRLAEDGPVSFKYRLKEMPTKAYPPRTKANVKLADFTVIFTHGNMTRGSKLTEKSCVAQNKPYLHIDVSLFSTPDHRLSALDQLDNLARQAKATSLNIAGTRESQSQGLQKIVHSFMLDYFRMECG